MRRGDWRKILGSTALIALLSCPQAWANGNEASDLVAPYGYFPMALGSAPGPLTTHYLISSTTSFGATVNVKCYNEFTQRVGPPAGTTVTLAAFTMEPWDPVGLGLTTDLLFTGLGFCYFAEVGVGDDFAVTFIAGISEGNNLITTNNSVAIMSDTAQSKVLDGIGTSDANIPYWTNEGSWFSFLLFLNPTATGTDLTMNVYSPAGALLGTWNDGSPSLFPRDLDFISMIDAVPATAGSWGHADIATPDRGFMGWIVGLNLASFQAFMYPVPLDTDDIATPLGVGDRP